MAVSWRSESLHSFEFYHPLPPAAGMEEDTTKQSLFPWIAEDIRPFSGALRDNIRTFLGDHAAPVPVLEVPNVSAWTALLRSGDTTLRLQIYEELLNEHKPVFCDPCRIIGGHPHHAHAQPPPHSGRAQARLAHCHTQEPHHHLVGKP